VPAISFHCKLQPKEQAMPDTPIRHINIKILRINHVVAEGTLRLTVPATEGPLGMSIEKFGDNLFNLEQAANDARRYPHEFRIHLTTIEQGLNDGPLKQTHDPRTDDGHDRSDR